MRKKTENVKQGDSRGFTLIEVLISMMITIIVMGAVFALLTRGQRSFQREPQVADLQQSARTALDMISRDILQAGAGLPPEFPSITPPEVSSGVGDQGVGNPDVLEIIGGSGARGQISPDPEPVLTFDGTLATIEQTPTLLQVGDLVVVYNNDPENSDWAMRWVSAVAQDTPLAGQSQVNLVVTHDGKTVDSAYSQTDTSYPWNQSFVALVNVVRYDTQVQDGDLILMRRVNFEPPMPVGMLDDFQVVYLVGNQPQVEQPNPPHPHPTLKDGTGITPADIVTGVRVTVAARSQDENLEGSTVGASGNYIRKTFSSNINPRNISAGLSERTFLYQ